MDTVTLRYTVPGGVSTSTVTLNILSIKGYDDPDWVEFYPNIINTYLDGSKETQFKAFRRKIRVETDVVSDKNDRIAILYWYLDNAREICLNGGSYTTVVPQSEGYENEWVENFSGARKFIFELDVDAVETSFA